VGASKITYGYNLCHPGKQTDTKTEQLLTGYTTSSAKIKKQWAWRLKKSKEG